MNNEGCQTNSNNTSITAKDVLETIKSAKKFLETNPGVVNAANYVVKNGIKKGGYDVVRTAINGVFENGGEQGTVNAALDSLNNCFQGAGDLKTDFKQLGSNIVNRYKNGATSNNQLPNQYDNNVIDCEYTQQDDEEENVSVENNNLPSNMNLTNQQLMVGVGSLSVLKIGKTALKYGEQLPGTLDKMNNIIESATPQVERLSGNITKFRNSGDKLFASMKKKPILQETVQYADDALQYVDDAAELMNTGFTETAVQGAASTFQKSVSSAAKGGIVGAVIGITMETVMSYKKYKNGEITKEEYGMEIAKSGGQYGISGAVTAGITTSLTPALTAVAGAVGVACPVVSIPVSIAIGAGIDKIIAPAFGRGEYKKILDDAKYYQDIMHAHDDLVQAIEMSEQQFADFINEYQRQMQVHAQLKDTNKQINQLHKVADNQLNQQTKQLNNTLNQLGDLFNKI